MPSQKGFRCDDSGDFCQEFPAKRLTLYRKPTSLVVREAKLPPAKRSCEDSVLLESQLATSLEGRDESANQRGNHAGMVPADRRLIKFGARG